MTILLDPTDERSPAKRERLPRLNGISGKRIGLLDISKARGDVFLERLAERLTEVGAEVKRYRNMKPTFAKPAPVDLRHEIASNCDAVIEALAD